MCVYASTYVHGCVSICECVRTRACVCAPEYFTQILICIHIFFVTGKVINTIIIIMIIIKIYNDDNIINTILISIIKLLIIIIKIILILTILIMAIYVLALFMQYTFGSFTLTN